ncbi:putative hydrogenase accessory protein HupE/UreJ protein [Chondrocystis sp. NIES-4102]|nr:putative hydrogenase accessory protein HupE/UreJ protein [Chondrocystis sp. NIES-4102]
MKKNQAIAKSNSVIVYGCVVVLILVTLVANISPALAHHGMGGKLPSTTMEGLLSGLAHPVIGIDHLAFVVGVGLLASLGKRMGIMIPLFIFSTAMGTIIHLQNINLPIVEIVVAASVLSVGIFLAQVYRANLSYLVLLSAIAGIFHGYAYGESIIGAQTSAVGAYLLGFCLMQLVISAIAFYVGKRVIQNSVTTQSPLSLAGLIITGVGLAFLSTSFVG